MYRKIKEQVENPSLKHIEAKQYYVYRHYSIDENGKEKTFYVGKGQGFRGMSESSRNELWTRRVDELNGVYYIDIVKYFDNEREALNFEKELIAYYMLFEFGCRCNKQSTDVKDSNMLTSIHKKLFDNAMKNGTSMLDVVHLYYSIYPASIDNTNRLYDTMINLRDKLLEINSDFSIRLNPQAGEFNNTDIDCYVYRPVKEELEIIKDMFDKGSELKEIVEHFSHSYIEYNNTKLSNIIERLNKMLHDYGVDYEVMYNESESDKHSVAYEGYYYISNEETISTLDNKDNLLLLETDIEGESEEDKKLICC